MNKLITSILLFSSLHAFGQDDVKKDTGVKSGFKKENLFTGGGVTASFGYGTTVLGISPHLGYSLTPWADFAFVLNYNYTSQRDYQQYGDKARQTVYGPGAFVRLFPFKFLFAQAQYEYNFIRFKYIPASNGTFPPSTYNVNAGSLLLGGGYATGRSAGNNSYYYFSVLWDILKDKNSPYVDGLGRGIPIIKAGYNIALFQGRSRR